MLLLLNYPKIVAYMVKIVKFLVRIISEHLLKAIFLIFETETVGLCLVRKLKGGGGHVPPVATPLIETKKNNNKKSYSE